MACASCGSQRISRKKIASIRIIPHIRPDRDQTTRQAVTRTPAVSRVIPHGREITRLAFSESPYATASRPANVQMPRSLHEPRYGRSAGVRADNRMIAQPRAAKSPMSRSRASHEHESGSASDRGSARSAYCAIAGRLAVPRSIARLTKTAAISRANAIERAHSHRQHLACSLATANGHPRSNAVDLSGLQSPILHAHERITASAACYEYDSGFRSPNGRDIDDHGKAQRTLYDAIHCRSADVSPTAGFNTEIFQMTSPREPAAARSPRRGGRRCRPPDHASWDTSRYAR